MAEHLNPSDGGSYIRDADGTLRPDVPALQQDPAPEVLAEVIQPVLKTKIKE